jgi:ribose transport system permease protein
MVGVLLALCALFSLVTIRDEPLRGASAARAVLALAGEGARIVVVARPGADGDAFASAFGVQETGHATVVEVVRGDPPEVRARLEQLAGTFDAVATTSDVAAWPVFDALGLRADRAPRVLAAPSVRRSAFLNRQNLGNVLNQIAVIGVLAVGMTIVIITGGIDLSVGSLIALSSVLTAYLVRSLGGSDASAGAMIGASLAAILGSSLIGAGSGAMVTRLGLPPFIATLGVMQIASGLAFMAARGQTIYEVPRGFDWLGQRASILGIPNAVVLMLAVYAVGHVVLARTVLGRYFYAVGGNRDAARFAGVPVLRVLLLAYAISGLTAGIGGVITASMLTSGAGTYGQSYELFAIAAVVVGGTSLSGGEGRMLGTLVGALVIAVIQNAMNLTGVESYTQKVVLGAVILGAVGADRLRRHGWSTLKGVAA